MNKNIIYFIGLSLLTMSCSDNDSFDPTANFPTTVQNPVKAVTSSLDLNLSTDKALYKPGETVSFKLTGNVPAGLKVRYRHGNDVVAEADVTGSSWTWTAPQGDGTGYLADLYTTNGTTENERATIGIDVSSDWTFFPRYGFVSDFGPDKTDAVVDAEMEYLNRHHINGIQFYDWQNKHHWPAPVDASGNVLAEYKDIANRTTLTSVVASYISAQHRHGMKAMFYDLCFGALDDAAADGVKDQWYMFSTTNHGTKKSLDMVDSWKSDIFLTNPANRDWQAYMTRRVNEVYKALPFDGFHVDQLGDQGTVYDYFGSALNLPAGYHTFLNAMKAANPDKRLVMNAVSGFGSGNILSTGNVDFAYNEMWDHEAGFSDLHDVISANRSYSGGKCQQVFAAYMDYRKGYDYFNTPGVLLTDAVIYALGGDHLELGGDHMLYSEYFPDNHTQMRPDLKTAITRYYDFITAYENYLRGKGVETRAEVYSDTLNINVWPPKLSTVTTYARQTDGALVVNLLNFNQANSLSWRDLNGDMPEPKEVTNASLRVKAPGARRVWVASPDRLGGVPQELPFTTNGDYVTFTLPSLKYWTMVVVEQ